MAATDAAQSAKDQGGPSSFSQSGVVKKTGTQIEVGESPSVVHRVWCHIWQVGNYVQAYSCNWWQVS